MRLIDADALEDKTDDRYSLGEIGRHERDSIVDALGFEPAIDAVSVIRCSDCKYSYIEERTIVCGLRGFFIREDFFCADGERRENGDECMR